MKLYNISNRIFFFIFIILLLNTILLVNMYKIQILNYYIYSKKSYFNSTKIIPIYPIRGSIFDCNGIPLAISKEFYKLEIFPGNINDIDSMLFKLKKIIKLNNIEINYLKNKINKSVQYYPIYIKKKLTNVELYNFSVNKYKFPEIKVIKYYKRFYPYKHILSHVIGYISKANKKDLLNIKKNKNFLKSKYIGKTGIEKYYESILSGSIGFKEVEINNKGKLIKFKNKIKEENGRDIYLSVDLKLSEYIQKLLINSKGAVIVTDPRDGKILSLVSSPSFDLNVFTNRIRNNCFNNIFLDKNLPLLNRATQGIYPPASTIKPYIGLLALNEKIITTKYLLYDPGWWKLPNSNKIYKDWKKNGRGFINLHKAIEESSDTFFYYISYKMGIDKLYNLISKFGYGKYVNIDLYEENKGILPSKEWKFNRFKSKWYIGDTISVGIGQGYWSATPLQMCNSLIILINNGIIKTPYLLNGVFNYEKKCLETNDKYYKKIELNINKDYWNIIKNSMYDVANSNNGTASIFFKNAKYKIAAKSGTAQVCNLEYNIKNKIIPKYLKDHKLMIAFAPFDNPSVSVVTILENGGNGISAGNITRKIFDYLLVYNKILNK